MQSVGDVIKNLYMLLRRVADIKMRAHKFTGVLLYQYAGITEHVCSFITLTTDTRFKLGNFNNFFSQFLVHICA